MHKIVRSLHRATTTRQAMPQLWFDTIITANIAVPFSMWTQNYFMLLIAAGLEAICVIWYMLGWQPVRKPARRPVTAATRTRTQTRTRRAPVRRKVG